MGNREIKITPVKTGCRKAGNGAGLQGRLSAEGWLSVCGGLPGAERLSHRGCLGENTQFSHAYGPTLNPRGRGSTAPLAAGWHLVFPKT